MPGTPPVRPSPSRRRRESGAARLAVIAVTVVVIGTAAALAIPKFLGTGEVAPVVGPAPAAKAVPAALPAPAASPARAAPAAPRIETWADGDLAIHVTPRIATPVTGTAVQATVRFVNHGLEAFHLPAGGEPHPTLAIVVLDAEANEVRRVVEAGPDPYPRRTTLLASGGTTEMQVQIVSPEDAPLPPGEYTIYAEFRRDPVWDRLGLPTWKAPRGAIRSAQTALTVLPRE